MTPIEALSQALSAIGYDPAKFRMEAREERCEGNVSYINRTIYVALPNGKSESFMAHLAALHPAVGAAEIDRLMKMYPPPLDPGPEEL